MSISVIRKAHFNAAHRLYNPKWSMERNDEVFGLCNNPNFHGHNYVLEVKVSGDINAETGFVIDLKDLSKLIEKEVCNRFDHKNLNLDCPEFKDLNPTAENIAVVIWDLLRPAIDAQLKLAVTLAETPRNSVYYEGI